MQALRATIAFDNVQDMQDVLEALVRISVRQIRKGLAPLFSQSKVRYREERPGKEEWLTAAQSNKPGRRVDCEDMAIWCAASYRVRGKQARVVIRKRPGSRVMHALVQVKPANGRALLVDPSRARGMR